MGDRPQGPFQRLDQLVERHKVRMAHISCPVHVLGGWMDSQGPLGRRGTGLYRQIGDGHQFLVIDLDKHCLKPTSSCQHDVDAYFRTVLAVGAVVLLERIPSQDLVVVDHQSVCGPVRAEAEAEGEKAALVLGQ